MPFLITFWREIVMVLMAVALFQVWSIYSNRVEDRDNTIVALNAEAKLNEIQKDTLRQAILDQNEEVEAHRIDAVKRVNHFEAESKRIKSEFEKSKTKVEHLSGDLECEAMRRIVNEAVQ